MFYSESTVKTNCCPIDGAKYDFNLLFVGKYSFMHLFFTHALTNKTYFPTSNTSNHASGCGWINLDFVASETSKYNESDLNLNPKNYISFLDR